MIQWLEVARAWRRASEAADAARGDRETLVRNFARGLRVDPSSVRRSNSALEFAEAMQAAGRIRDPDELERVSLEKLTLLHRVSRLSADEAANLLPDVIGNRRTVRELRVMEADIRARIGEAAAAREGANTLVSLLGGSTFRDDAAAAYQARERARGSQTVRLTGRGGFVESPHVIARVTPGGPFHAARLVPSVGLGSSPGRYSGIIALAVALSRVFERVDVIAQSQADAESIAVGVRNVGPCGVGVLTLDREGPLEELHEATRTRRPDLLGSHVGALDAQFPSVGRRDGPKGGAGTSGR